MPPFYARSLRIHQRVSTEPAMKKTRISAAVMTVILGAALASCGKQADTAAEQAAKEAEKVAAEAKAKAGAAAKAAEALAKEKEAELTAIESYVYAYPLVTMEMTRRVMTNVAAVEGTRGPMGQFVRLRSYPDASYRDVTAPHADTLYTTPWLDVAKEPWILSIPDMKGRYFLFP